MKMINNEKIVCFDVDDTLIRWGDRVIGSANSSEEYEFTEANGTKHTYRSIEANIAALKEHASRGHFIIVWSAGGGAWAAKAVQILGLEQYVGMTMAKPTWSYDDLQAEHILTRVIYAGDDDFGLESDVSKMEKIWKK